jgi:AAA15 family ATPase/GTPase
VSQVLPVLVAAYASQGSILAMEQPEIHLHPALQAELGDVFIESALGPRGNTFILETHSEHLILRLLRRIRETTNGELPPDLTPYTSRACGCLIRPARQGRRQSCGDPNSARRGVC